MPNKRSADKETLSFYVPRTLGARLRRLARSRNETVTGLVVGILNHSVMDVELTAEDYETIAKAVRAAQNKR
jgi:hypothetical protein